MFSKRFLLAGFLLLTSLAGYARQEDAGDSDTTSESESDRAAAEAAMREALAAVADSTPAWLPKKGPFHPSKTMINQLLHTKLQVRFDFARREMPGKANITLRPFFYPTDSLTLDAKYMRINRVALVTKTGLKDLKFTYADSTQLLITLDRVYTRAEKYEIFIDYVARPTVGKRGGSEAITDDQGLYFINHDLKRPGVPRQIWTQGETESTSRWAPTIEATNQRCTSEIFMTVPDTMTTLSNGALLASVKNADRTRTDHWSMTQPHAPYLFMMGAGNFRITRDTWRGKEVSYYTEPQYQRYARLIFGNTPEMLEFFSKRLGVAYPWNKYSQMVARDFVSGAMENTTATIHFDQLQHDSRAHLDETQEDYISHELFHQWFGDYVTTESWANLPLNESFATYGEYLWREYKYGVESADEHLQEDINMYWSESENKREPLIRYYYDDKENMFDRHTYQKGGRILHMLRRVIGDDAFFEGLKQYLSKHAYSAVEVAELRMAFEDVSGRDLMWFFDQWFMRLGHPELNVEYGYDAKTNKVGLRIEQTQDLRYMPVYRLPVQIMVAYPNGRVSYINTEVSTLDTVIRFSVDEKPLFVDFDPEKVLVAQVTEDKPLEYWVAQATQGKHYGQKYKGLHYLAENNADETGVKALLTASRDAFWGVRREAMGLLLPMDPSAEIFDRAVELASKDPHAPVRTLAARFLNRVAAGEAEGFTADAAKLEAALIHAANDSSYATAAVGLRALYGLNKSAGLNAVKANMNVQSPTIREVVSGILLKERAPEAFDYTLATLRGMSGGTLERFNLLQTFGAYLAQNEGEEQRKGLAYLMDVAKKGDHWVARIGAVRGLVNFASLPEVKALFEDLKQTEPNEELRALYNRQL